MNDTTDRSYEMFLEMYEQYTRIKHNPERVKVCSELYMYDRALVKDIVKLFENITPEEKDLLRANKHELQKKEVRYTNRGNLLVHDKLVTLSGDELDIAVKGCVEKGLSLSATCKTLSDSDSTLVKELYRSYILQIKAVELIKSADITETKEELYDSIVPGFRAMSKRKAITIIKKLLVLGEPEMEIYKYFDYLSYSTFKTYCSLAFSEH